MVPNIPRWETIDYPATDGYGPYTMTRAICEPDGYCAERHRCGKIDVGIEPIPAAMHAVIAKAWKEHNVND